MAETGSKSALPWWPDIVEPDAIDSDANGSEIDPSLNEEPDSNDSEQTDSQIDIEPIQDKLLVLEKIETE